MSTRYNCGLVVQAFTGNPLPIQIRHEYFIQLLNYQRSFWMPVVYVLLHVYSVYYQGLQESIFSEKIQTVLISKVTVL